MPIYITVVNIDLQSTYYMEGNTGHRVFQTQFGEFTKLTTPLPNGKCFIYHIHPMRAPPPIFSG